MKDAFYQMPSYHVINDHGFMVSAFAVYRRLIFYDTLIVEQDALESVPVDYPSFCLRKLLLMDECFDVLADSISLVTVEHSTIPNPGNIVYTGHWRIQRGAKGGLVPITQY